MKYRGYIANSRKQKADAMSAFCFHRNTLCTTAVVIADSKHPLRAFFGSFTTRVRIVNVL
ncbi:MAG: hypothetical protein EAZ24_01040 [Burkholderiales bacterium]|nr:MAG: hypothetical protein EAZ21_04340 [Betaproteobacteria bacterium]TAG84567.1 MAG: hypothetical protein EAZ24_01040 [Burkholderiales bacterium]